LTAFIIRGQQKLTSTQLWRRSHYIEMEVKLCQLQHHHSPGLFEEFGYDEASSYL